MRVGLTLAGSQLNRDGAGFAAQLGVRDVVVHLTRYAHNADPTRYLAGEVGPDLGDCSDDPLWTYEDMAGIAAMLREFGIAIAALENFSPNFWSDVLLDGPRRNEQMEGLKRLVRDAGRAGIPCIGYNFSIAGVWGWRRRPIARGGAVTAAFDMSAFDAERPISGRHGLEHALPSGAGRRATALRLRDGALAAPRAVPRRARAGRRGGRHPACRASRRSAGERLRGTARLVNAAEKYDRLLAIVDSPANALEFCIGSLQEMPDTDIYATTRRFARQGRIAYVHFRNVRGRVPDYHETFVDDGDVDMAEIVRILRDEGFAACSSPTTRRSSSCPAPWHAGHAYAIGYMRALIPNADALGPSCTAARDATAFRTRSPEDPAPIRANTKQDGRRS